MHSEPIRYRREIDGLRAVAVIPVILFHAGVQAFSGGFVGVDVFFVISGYLITSMILAEREVGSFSLVRFYERRARRILPALFVVLVASFALAWVWLLPDDMKSFSQSLMAVNGFVSNIFFFFDTSYFAPDAELRPLLHTWSLAVEEQYYLVYPFFLAVAWRFGRRRIAQVLAVACVVSLGLAHWGAITHPRYTFFMPHTRAWEILFGALIAFVPMSSLRDALSKDGRSTAINQLLAGVGLFLIAVAVVRFGAQTPSPSLYTAAPVLGTGLIIVYATEDTLVGRVLGSPLLVGIGLISYSLYLWHQPLFAFARYRSSAEPDRLVFVLLTAVAVVLASLSWKYIETPIRRGRGVTRAQIFSAAAVGAAAFMGVGLVGALNEGFYGRFSESEARVLRYSHYDYKPVYRVSRCFLDENQGLPFAEECDGRNTMPLTVIWGDSHAAALSAGLRRTLPNVAQYTASRCLPIKDDEIADRPDCKRINDYVMARIAQARPDRLFLHADWRRHKNQEPAANIRKTIAFVRAVSPGTDITIVGGVPQWHPSLPILMFRRHMGFGDVHSMESSAFDEIAAMDRAFLVTATETHVHFASSLDALCTNEQCQFITALDGVPTLTAWDYGHLTEGGSVLLATRLLRASVAN